MQTDLPPPLEDDNKSGDENEEERPFVPRRSGRTIKPTLVGLESAANLCWSLVTAPVTTKQATADPNWREAMKKEVQSLKDLGTFQVVNRPSDRKVITTRWVFQEKEANKGKDRFKAHWSPKVLSRRLVSTKTIHGPPLHAQIQFAFWLLL